MIKMSVEVLECQERRAESLYPYSKEKHIQKQKKNVNCISSSFHSEI